MYFPSEPDVKTTLPIHLFNTHYTIFSPSYLAGPDSLGAEPPSFPPPVARYLGMPLRLCNFATTISTTRLFCHPLSTTTPFATLISTTPFYHPDHIVIVGKLVLVVWKDNRFLRPRPAIYLWLTNAISLEYDKLIANNKKARITPLIKEIKAPTTTRAMKSFIIYSL